MISDNTANYLFKTTFGALIISAVIGISTAAHSASQVVDIIYNDTDAVAQVETGLNFIKNATTNQERRVGVEYIVAAAKKGNDKAKAVLAMINNK